MAQNTCECADSSIEAVKGDDFLRNCIDDEGVVFRQWIVRWEAKFVDVEVIRCRRKGTVWRCEYRFVSRFVLEFTRIWGVGA